MNRILKNLAIALLGMAFTTSAFGASTLLVTPVSTGNGYEIEIEFLNEGEVSGFQFEIFLGRMDKKNVDFSGCAAGMKGAMASCNFVDGHLKMAVLSTDPLPTGAVGTIVLHDGAPFAKNGAKVKNLLMTGKSGRTNGEAIIGDKLTRAIETSELERR